MGAMDFSLEVRRSDSESGGGCWSFKFWAPNWSAAERSAAGYEVNELIADIPADE
jgi:hypothetical protein